MNLTTQNTQHMTTTNKFFCFWVSEENETFFPVGKIFTMTHEEFMNHPEINKDGQPLLWGYEDMRTASFCYSKAKMDSEFCFSN